MNMPVAGRTALVAACAAVALTGCERQVAAPQPERFELDAPATGTITADQDAFEATLDLPQGTPMAERVATIGLLNKRNSITQDLELRPGEERRIEDVIIRLEACERTAPWEDQPETGAFVQVLVQTAQRNDPDARYAKVFSGWLFKSSPSLNVVEHPIYDVWVKECAMSYPGEEARSSTDENPTGNAV
ncbi:DUF2155 domain-containing protein [Croceicoccus sp. F390]|uniref:DUF2155 domain-containing protein n=1 Tax=Croceicoccus esteveae TaxID=3075597 RepID=A0ABU2ZJQ2_9SPHN|nr:DUF2155 domain-containing protein [Croceicoccus sp. F390]MDT0576823.1 DUF2155 domain-containing protein [Croceicoccus sp. F390]